MAAAREEEEDCRAQQVDPAKHGGDPEEEQAEQDVAPLRSLGEPIVDAIVRKSYSDVNAQFDFGFPDGALNYWKSSFLKSLPDEAIDQIVADFAEAPSRMTVLLIEDLHGQITRVPVDATAIPHRAQGFNLLIPSVWLDPIARVSP